MIVLWDAERYFVTFEHYLHLCHIRHETEDCRFFVTIGAGERAHWVATGWPLGGVFLIPASLHN